MDTRTQRNARTAFVGLAVAIAVAACQAGAASGPATTTDPGSATSGPAPTATATPRPTPTPKPIEELFLENADDAVSASGSISGELTTGGNGFDIEGEFTIDGSDSDTLTVLRLGDTTAETQEIILDGKTYKRTGDGPWLDVTGATSGSGPGSTIDLDELFAEVDELEPAERLVRDGRTVYRLAIPADELDARQLGVIPAGARNGEADLAFYSEKDGTFAGAAISASWLPAAAAETDRVLLELELLVDEVPARAKVARPEDVWVPLAPAGAACSFAIPEDWEIVEGPDAITLQGPGANSIVIVSAPLTSDVTLNQWTSESVLLIQQEGGTVTGNNEASVAGGPARLISYEIAYNGVAVKGVDAAFVAGGRGYDIFFETGSGTAEDALFFGQFLTTVAITDSGTGPAPAPAPGSPQPAPSA